MNGTLFHALVTSGNPKPFGQETLFNRNNFLEASLEIYWENISIIRQNLHVHGSRILDNGHMQVDKIKYLKIYFISKHSTLIVFVTIYLNVTFIMILLIISFQSSPATLCNKVECCISNLTYCNNTCAVKY